MRRLASTAFVLHALVFVLLGTGCARISGAYDHPGRDLPVYENAQPEAVLESMRQRDAALTAWRATGTLLVAREGSTTRLDGIMLIDALDTPSPSLRLRASKLGRNAMDLVFADGRAWVWTRGGERDAAGEESNTPPINLPLALLRSDSLTFDRPADDHLVFKTRQALGGRPAEVWVHQSTRAIHRIVFETPDGPITTELRYRRGEPAPHLDALRLSLNGQPLVEFQVKTFQPNPALTPAHFQPIPGSRPLGDATPAGTAG